MTTPASARTPSRPELAWAFGSRALPFAIGIATTVALTRILPVTAYGILASAIAIVTIAAALFDAGMSAATARLLAEARFPRRLVARVALTSWVIGTSAAVVLLLAGGAALSRALGLPAIATLTPLLATALAIRLGQLRVERMAEGLRRQDVVARCSAMVGWSVPVAAVVVPMLLTPTAGAALAGQTAGQALLLAATVLRLAGALRDAVSGDACAAGASVHGWRWTRRERAVLRRLGRYARPQAAVSVSLVAYSQSGVLLVQRLLGATDAGLYAFALRVLEVLALPGYALASASGPRFAGIAGSAWPLARRLTVRLLGAYLPLMAAVWLLAPWGIGMIFGAGYEGAATVVRWLLPLLACRVVASLYGAALDYLGSDVRRAVAVVAVVATYVALAFALIPGHGVRGAAIVSLVAYLPLVAAYAWMIAHRRAPARRRSPRVRTRGAAPAPVSLAAGERPDVALFSMHLELGGAERMIAAVANALVERGHRVDVVLVSARGAHLAELHPAVRVVPLGVPRLRHALGALRRYLATARPRVLYSRLTVANVVAAVAVGAPGGAARPRLVLQESSVPSRARHAYGAAVRLAYAVAPLLYRRADAVVAISEGVADEIRRLLRVPPERVHVVHNPARPLPETGPLAAPHPWLRRGDAGGRGGGVRAPRTVLSVGRVTRAKGVDLLLDALAVCHDLADTRALILGEGAARAELEAQAARLGIADRVAFVGHVAEPRHWMAHADAVVLTSHFESFSNVLVEALQVGTPVVSVDCPYGPREILEDGAYGVLVRTRSPEALAGGIAATVASPPDSQRLRARAATFSRAATMARLEAIFGISPAAAAHGSTFVVAAPRPLAPPLRGEAA